MNKLSAKEMHIYVTQGLQRQGAYKKDKQYPGAIDIALNIAQSRIIKARLVQNSDVPHKFEINSKHVSDIQMLIKTDFELQVFKGLEKSYGVLPYDFSYLLGDISYVIEDCQAEFVTATESKTERAYVILFDTGKLTTPYYELITVAYNATSKAVTTPGFTTKDEKVYLVDSIIAAYKELGLTVYWENYKDIYKPSSFIIPSFALTGFTVAITVDNTTYASTYADIPETTFKALPVGKKAVNRDTKMDFLYSASRSNYHKSLPDSPLAVLAENKITVYGTERFLANKILVNYIRKPKRINLALNQGSELSPSTHEDICDLAVQILKKHIEDDSYPKDVEDNRQRIE